MAATATIAKKDAQVTPAKKDAQVTPEPPGQPKLFNRYVVVGSADNKTGFHVIKQFWTTTGTGGEEKLPVTRRMGGRYATAEAAQEAARAMQAGTYVKRTASKLAGMTDEQKAEHRKAMAKARREEIAKKLAQLEAMLAEQAAQG